MTDAAKAGAAPESDALERAARDLVAEAAGGAHDSCCGGPCLLVGRMADTIDALLAERTAARAAIAAVREIADDLSAALSAPSPAEPAADALP